MNLFLVLSRTQVVKLYITEKEMKSFVSVLIKRLSVKTLIRRVKLFITLLHLCAFREHVYHLIAAVCVW